MCFGFIPVGGTLSQVSPYFEVGFSLSPDLAPECTASFILTVKNAVNVPFVQI